MQELLDSNFKCISGGNTCKPNTNGGPHLGFQSGGIYFASFVKNMSDCFREIPHSVNGTFFDCFFPKMAGCQQVFPLRKKCLITLMDVAWMNASIGIAASQNAWFMMLAVKKCWALVFTTIHSKHYCTFDFPPVLAVPKVLHASIRWSVHTAGQPKTIRWKWTVVLSHFFLHFVVFSFPNRSHVLMWDWGEFCRSVLLHFACCMFLNHYITTFATWSNVSMFIMYCSGKNETVLKTY